MKTFIVFCVLTLGTLTVARIVSEDELQEKLRGAGVPEGDISTWKCIVQHESQYRTDAHNDETDDNGIFQISAIFWCSDSDPENSGCKITCSSLLDDNIDNDVQCALTVFEETKKLPQANNDGFTAWTVYNNICRFE